MFCDFGADKLLNTLLSTGIFAHSSCTKASNLLMFLGFYAATDFFLNPTIDFQEDLNLVIEMD